MLEYLYHYYDQSSGPFRNLSDLEPKEAERILQSLRQRGDSFAGKRAADYMAVRRELEAKARVQFIWKGGKPIRATPHYMTLGECPWLLDWYPQGAMLRIPVSRFDPGTVSFTYGDLFPAMRYEDGRAYRKQVYNLDEIRRVIGEFGWPQQWNANGDMGPERYIEAQIWDDAPLKRYIKG